MSQLADEKRNAAVCRLVDERRLSYAVIAEMMDITRNAVAGIVFRRNHPLKTRISCVGTRSRSKIGTGYKPQTYYPEKTALNTR